MIPNALSTAHQLVRLIEDKDCPGSASASTSGTLVCKGDVVDALETVAGYLVTTHLHDNRGRTDDHLLPFEGVIDWPELLIGFQKVGYDGTLMFESRPPQMVPWRRCAVPRRRDGASSRCSGRMRSRSARNRQGRFGASP